MQTMVSSCKGKYTCHPCVTAKLTRTPHTTVCRANLKPLEILSSDTAGPLTRSTRGNRYFTAIADQATSYLNALPTRTKSAAGEKLVETVRRLQHISGHKVLRLHSDGVGELAKGAPLRFAQTQGIQITKTAPNTPRRNGQAEPAIRTLKECIRSQLKAARMPEKYWDYALQDCVAKQNALPRPNTTASPTILL